MSLSTFPLSSKEVFRRRSDLFFDPSSAAPRVTKRRTSANSL